MKKEQLKKYAELLVKKGVNLQKKQILVVSASINARPLVVEIVKAAYKAGAADVEIAWSDDEISKIAYKKKTATALSVVPEWEITRREYFIDKKIAYLGIISGDPEAFKDISAKKLSAARRVRNKAFAQFREYTSSNKIRWCICGYPDKEWAKKVFPDLNKNDAVKKLWDHIAKTVRLDADDPVEEWEKHQRELQRRCDFLNSAKIKSFHYENGLGTNFDITMPKGYIFCGGAEKGALDGVWFTANMPTEEIFSCPDKSGANGKLVSSMPLCRNGQIIKDFWLEFDEGRIVDFGAKEGYENLKSIIETDEGSHYLGEIALVAHDSVISKLNTLFFETLYDENASCHFAIGDCYPTCVEGGADMTEEQLAERGLNNSLEHVDFMVGTKDLQITATTDEGKQITIFKDGGWAI